MQLTDQLEIEDPRRTADESQLEEIIARSHDADEMDRITVRELAGRLNLPIDEIKRRCNAHCERHLLQERCSALLADNDQHRLILIHRKSFAELSDDRTAVDLHATCNAVLVNYVGRFGSMEGVHIPNRHRLPFRYLRSRGWIETADCWRSADGRTGVTGEAIAMQFAHDVDHIADPIRRLLHIREAGPGDSNLPETLELRVAVLSKQNSELHSQVACLQEPDTRLVQMAHVAAVGLALRNPELADAVFRMLGWQQLGDGCWRNGAGMGSHGRLSSCRAAMKQTLTPILPWLVESLDRRAVAEVI